jgi:hypothetical protein
MDTDAEEVRALAAAAALIDTDIKTSIGPISVAQQPAMATAEEASWPQADEYSDQQIKSAYGGYEV